MDEYANDITAATIESHHSLLKLGICESTICAPPKRSMNGAAEPPQAALCPLV
jgi:hypothetical protein